MPGSNYKSVRMTLTASSVEKLEALRSGDKLVTLATQITAIVEYESSRNFFPDVERLHGTAVTKYVDVGLKPHIVARIDELREEKTANYGRKPSRSELLSGMILSWLNTEFVTGSYFDFNVQPVPRADLTKYKRGKNKGPSKPVAIDDPRRGPHANPHMKHRRLAIHIVKRLSQIGYAYVPIAKAEGWCRTYAKIKSVPQDETLHQLMSGLGVDSVASVLDLNIQRDRALWVKAKAGRNGFETTVEEVVAWYDFHPHLLADEIDDNLVGEFTIWAKQYRGETSGQLTWHPDYEAYCKGNYSPDSVFEWIATMEHEIECWDNPYADPSERKKWRWPA